MLNNQLGLGNLKNDLTIGSKVEVMAFTGPTGITGEVIGISTAATYNYMNAIPAIHYKVKIDQTGDVEYFSEEELIVLPQLELKLNRCTCGAEKVNSLHHSSWCDIG